ncbi:hypothetical protein BJ138DRAFT_1161133 [Hygrophoropsis aurantiaca]|uniref:Uncharacterized protein n=1 Tax=Hygrophoropsis aurantiaca TaxID=72124 RepID=A0ACB8A1I5_9AGAM|nr:hypothetical protein BJ138DRAFT_1161133 [Hygrophoropsis aurantiaca]
MESTLLEHPRSPNFMDTPFTYDSMSNLEPYLQYPQSPYGVSMPLPGPSSSSPRLDFNSLNLANSMGEYSYSSSGSYTTASPGRPYTPPDNGISPPALYSLSGGELSSDGLTSGRRSRGSGTHSPASVHNVPYAASASRRKSRNDDSDDEDDDFQPVIPNNASTDMRRETIRRQRIESEQRRRDELRDGYRRLKDALPVSNQKSSKVSLLDRATTHVKYLEMTAQQLQTRLQQAENEVQRLRTVNEALMLGTAEQRHAAVAAAVAAVSQQSQSSF